MSTSLLTDPADLHEYAKRGDPPIDLWPGTPVMRQQLMKAGGDPRDWFRFRHREKAAIRTWAEFADARARRRNFTSGFEWNQILLLGDYGVGKTTIAIKFARDYFRLGHPVFSNASCLFGWHLEGEEIYTAMGFMPANSILLIDESSAALASRVGHGVAVSSFNEMNLNTRKRNCVVVYMSAHDWEIAPSIRRNCKEVWMPVPKDDLNIDDAGHETGTRQAPASNPDNFRLAYHVWDDYPYRKANLIEGKDADQGDGFGPPTYTMYDQGENVRDAFLLNDTFELAGAGAATLADRDVVKGQLAAFHDGSGPIRRNGGGYGRGEDDRVEKLLLFLEEHEHDPPDFFKAADIARSVGISSAMAGKLIQEVIPVSPVNRRGYPADVIYDYINGLGQELGGAQ